MLTSGFVCVSPLPRNFWAVFQVVFLLFYYGRNFPSAFCKSAQLLPQFLTDVSKWPFAFIAADISKHLTCLVNSRNSYAYFLGPDSAAIKYYCEIRSSLLGFVFHLQLANIFFSRKSGEISICGLQSRLATQAFTRTHNY